MTQLYQLWIKTDVIVRRSSKRNSDTVTKQTGVTVNFSNRRSVRLGPSLTMDGWIDGWWLD